MMDHHRQQQHPSHHRQSNGGGGAMADERASPPPPMPPPHGSGVIISTSANNTAATANNTAINGQVLSLSIDRHHHQHHANGDPSSPLPPLLTTGGGASGGESCREGWLLVRVHVPELNVHKCLQFPAEQLVWDVKQQCLAALPKELKESFNYGLFSPPANGRAGKFLDEERRLGDYPFNGPVGYLELKYKRRVYKMLKLDERQLKSLHTRANLRRFLEYAQAGQVDKLNKMCAKGLDPNFHCQETGETPLSLACAAQRPGRTLIALVNGGALLDYRTRDGTTALHRAVEKDSLEAVRTLLELGASPNYRDSRGLTPVYASVSRETDPALCEALLHDHAALGAKDQQGWQEVHQACRNGLVQHLEHLLCYGADADARNASGNTPLHVCAVNAQEGCARVLLFRGAQRAPVNYSSQTPYQVAVIAGNMELAEVIRNYSNQDIVPFRGPPRYNPKRRSAAWGGVLQPPLSPLSDYQPSLVNTAIAQQTYYKHAATGNHEYQGGSVKSYYKGVGGGYYKSPGGCPSPDISDRPFSSASSSLGSDRSHEDDVSLITDKSGCEGSESSSSGVGTAGSDFLVTSQSGGGVSSAGVHHQLTPGATVVCLEPYQPQPQTSGHLELQRGDVLEVTGATDCGLLEGVLSRSNNSGGGGGGVGGLFPAHCVQEVRLRHHQQHNDQHSNSNNTNNANGGGCAVTSQHHVTIGDRHYSATAPRLKKPLHQQAGGVGEQLYFGARPRGVVLHRARRGFGFVLRGAKAASPLMALRPSQRCPALQYLDDVDPGGAADAAGLRPGDFLLAINGTDVTGASHERVVELIRASGDLVQMTVVSPPLNTQQSSGGHSQDGGGEDYQDGGGVGGQYVNSGGGGYGMSVKQHYATLPRKAGGPFPPGGATGGTLGRSGAPPPPRRDPRTTLSVGRARAKSMVAGLEGGGERSETVNNGDLDSTAKSSSAESVQQQQQLSHNNSPGGNGYNAVADTDYASTAMMNSSFSTAGTASNNTAANNQPRTASIRARPTSSKITAAELEEMFQRQQSSSQGNSSAMMCSSRFQSGHAQDYSPPNSAAGGAASGGGNSSQKPRVYASVAEMKRKGKNSVRGKPVAVPRVELLHRDFHSSPDLAASLNNGGGGGGVWGTWSAKTRTHRSHENVRTGGGLANGAIASSMTSLLLQQASCPLPPPTHPPPPPPVGQLVRVDLGQEHHGNTQGTTQTSSTTTTSATDMMAQSEPTAGETAATAVGGVMSSFRPDSSAKLYAAPQDVAKLHREGDARNEVRKSQSMRGCPTSVQQQQNASPGVNAPSQSQSQSQSANQYAQPIRKNSRTESLCQNALPPPIPEPDYSMSEGSDAETADNAATAKVAVRSGGGGGEKHVQRIQVPSGPPPPPAAMQSDDTAAATGGHNKTAAVQPQQQSAAGSSNNGNARDSAAETSGNSNTSGSSTGSTSLAHSFSVDEIQKIRTQLKSSKSYPDDFKGEQQQSQQQQQHAEQADNSSSGVSSDQEINNATTAVAVDEAANNKAKLQQQQQQQQQTTNANNGGGGGVKQRSDNTPCQNQQQQQQQATSLSNNQQQQQRGSGLGSLAQQLAQQPVKLKSHTCVGAGGSSNVVLNINNNNASNNSGLQTRTMQRHNSLTRKQANNIAMNRASGCKTLGRSAAERLGIEPVSLAQLPPPLEADCDESADLYVPPPPEFIGGGASATSKTPPKTTNSTATAKTNSGGSSVLAPPPQFSDRSRQTATNTASSNIGGQYQHINKYNAHGCMDFTQGGASSVNSANCMDFTTNTTTTTKKVNFADDYHPATMNNKSTTTKSNKSSSSSNCIDFTLTDYNTASKQKSICHQQDYSNCSVVDYSKSKNLCIDYNCTEYPSTNDDGCYNVEYNSKAGIVGTNQNKYGQKTVSNKRAGGGYNVDFTTTSKQDCCNPNSNNKNVLQQDCCGARSGSGSGGTLQRNSGKSSGGKMHNNSSSGGVATTAACKLVAGKVRIVGAVPKGSQQQQGQGGMGNH